MANAGYSRNDVENAFREHGITFLQENEGLAIYQTLDYPGGDIIIDWTSSSVNLVAIQSSLRDIGADPGRILKGLTES